MRYLCVSVLGVMTLIFGGLLAMHWQQQPRDEFKPDPEKVRQIAAEYFELKRQLQLERQLRRVKSVTIRYMGRATPFSSQLTLTISDRKEVQALLDTFQVRETDPSSLGLDPAGAVDFRLSDGSVLSLAFAHETQLMLEGGGQLYLKDRAFYDKVNGLLSKRAGRPMDVLKYD